MNYRMLNAVRDIQVLLKEAGVYPGTIDGAWGKNTSDGALALFNDYHHRINGGRTKPLAISKAVGEAGALQGIKDIQSNLKLFNLYPGAVDGISGLGTNTYAGFSKVFSSYRAYNKLPVYGAAWSALVSPEFVAKVRAWCRKWNLWAEAPHALMACMYFESGGTFDPAKRNNGGSNYYGLIQFGEMAAKDLGIPLADIIKMSQLDQLDLAFKYFEMWMKRGKRYTRLEDFYLTIFYPAAVGKKPDEILFRKDSDIKIEVKSYLQNNGFDFNKDGVITVGEINTTVYTAYYKGLLPANRAVEQAPV